MKLRNGSPVTINNSGAADGRRRAGTNRSLTAATMKLTDIFIRRPVLASVVSLLILVLGLRALDDAAGPAISADRERRGHGHHDLLRRRSRRGRRLHHHAAGERHRAGQRHRLHDARPARSGVSTITVYLRLNYDADKALTEINTKINSVLNQLPHRHAAADADGQGRPDHRRHVYRLQQRACWRRTRSPTTSCASCSRSCRRCRACRRPRSSGGKNFALRAWLDPEKLAAYGLTATDVSQALAANNYISGLGNTKGQMVQVDLTASTDLHSLDEFRNLVLKQSGGAIVRLKDVANVTLGSDDYETAGRLRRQAGRLYRHPGRAGGQPAGRDPAACARSSRTSRRSCRRA